MLRAIDRFAAMTQKQRDALTRNSEALDPITAEALVTAPASLTGISKMHRQQLVDRALQAQHGDRSPSLKNSNELSKPDAMRSAWRPESLIHTNSISLQRPSSRRSARHGSESETTRLTSWT